MPTTKPSAKSGLRFVTIDEARKADAALPNSASNTLHLLDWIETYLMKSHPDLGRTGAVCPFTRQAAKLDTVRLAVSGADASREAEVFADVRSAFQVLSDIPSKKGMDHFRTVIMGFPGCADETGIAMLKRVQRGHRFYSLARGRMIGMMHVSSEDQGLWNPEFRPLRSPMPVLAIRHMVEQDAPFAAKHPALMAAYLTRFPFKGARRLASHWMATGR